MNHSKTSQDKVHANGALMVSSEKLHLTNCFVKNAQRVTNAVTRVSTQSVNLVLSRMRKGRYLVNLALLENTKTKRDNSLAKYVPLGINVLKEQPSQKTVRLMPTRLKRAKNHAYLASQDATAMMENLKPAAVLLSSQ